MPVALDIQAQAATFFIACVWRDYVRQIGAITLDSAAYQCLTGDTRSSDLALWPADGADMAVLQSRTRSAAQQAVAIGIGIGLFGVAASFSAQVLARRKEFGLLAHLGLTRRQILAVVAGEGAAWTGIGAIAGVLLGLAVSVVLVHVVNPQSFHWTMEMNIPAPRLWALCAAVVSVTVTVTAWLAGRDAAVKEDW